MVSSTQIGVGLGLSAAAFLGYCIYFDRQRRTAPDFRQKLREKRRSAAKKAKYGATDFSDHEAVQRFFLKEVQCGEDLLGQGTYPMDRLWSAACPSRRPATDPPHHIYSLLLQNLDIAQKRVRNHATSTIKDSARTTHHRPLQPL
ncbi:Mitochondrial import receptor subunit TOM20 -like protein [Caligus rogercresseyi]|uniref:Mitochondrial import receptor subunit TOM20 -like protein n=1 Tax=Caligus rogercresseyi TaxID=217165 RepID=A0A7T8HKM6_CALRO|nr:Mitochondrial import receptor subunit TOM20 -like protein [Caligus rogercresseyi]